MSRYSELAKETIGYSDIKDLYLAINKESERAMKESFDIIEQYTKTLSTVKMRTVHEKGSDVSIISIDAYITGYEDAIRDMKIMFKKKLTRLNHLNRQMEKFKKWYEEHFDEISGTKRLEYWKKVKEGERNE